jgi:hypothetical protein
LWKVREIPAGFQLSAAKTDEPRVVAYPYMRVGQASQLAATPRSASDIQKKVNAKLF